MRGELKVLKVGQYAEIDILMAQFIRYDMGMLTLKAVEGVQESSKAMLEYHVLASS